MTSPPPEVPGHWPCLAGATLKLAAQRENIVWRADTGSGSYALRAHRKGYRSAAELASEMQWMRYLAQCGLHVPMPIATAQGADIVWVEDQPFSLLTWLAGAPVGAGDELREGLLPEPLCRALGEAMARLHTFCDDWTLPPDFARPDWRAEGLLGDDPLWGRFWDHPHLDARQRSTLSAAREAARDALRTAGDRMDQGLIHADLLCENVLISDRGLAMIDFDDGAWGYRDFELATFLLRFVDHPAYDAMRAALCDGYGARRTVRDQDLSLCLLLRALTYPGWIADRLHEQGADARSVRAINIAVRLSEAYLQGRPT